MTNPTINCTGTRSFRESRRLRPTPRRPDVRRSREPGRRRRCQDRASRWFRSSCAPDRSAPACRPATTGIPRAHNEPKTTGTRFRNDCVNCRNTPPTTSTSNSRNKARNDHLPSLQEGRRTTTNSPSRWPNTRHGNGNNARSSTGRAGGARRASVHVPHWTAVLLTCAQPRKRPRSSLESVARKLSELARMSQH